MSLDRSIYFVRERVGLTKLHESYDIMDASSGELLGSAVEQASSLRKGLKLLVNKNLLPFQIELRDASGDLILTIERGLTLMRSKIRVSDASGAQIGTFRQKLLSIGGRFELFDAHEQKVADLKGNVVGWNFKFHGVDGAELGQVTRKWGGVGRELFTSADNYVVALSAEVDPVGTGPLLLAAALCIDMAFKER